MAQQSLDVMLDQLRKQRRAQLDAILQQAQSQQSGQMAGMGGGGAQRGGSGLGGLASLGSAVGTLGSLASSLGGAASVVGATGSAASGLGGLASLLSMLSSRRFKHEIEPVKEVAGLHWVRFKYLPEIDPEQAERLGLLAEDLDAQHPEWVVKDENGLPIGVRYDLIAEDLWP